MVIIMKVKHAYSKYLQSNNSQDKFSHNRRNFIELNGVYNVECTVYSV